MLEKQENNLLTDTELSVLELIVKEYSNEKIANSLFVSRRTVDTHVSNICSKLGVTSRVGAVREAIRLNQFNRLEKDMLTVDYLLGDNRNRYFGRGHKRTTYEVKLKNILEGVGSLHQEGLWSSKQSEIIQ